MAETLNELLVELQKAFGCPYLSDLHSANKLKSAEAQKLILSIAEERFTLETWNRAVAYITGATEVSNSIADAKIKLLNG